MPRSWLPILLLMLAPALGQAAGARVTVERAAERVGETFEVRIEDSWPNACVPELEAVEVDGPQIWIIARDTSEARFCGHAASDYSLDTGHLGAARLGAGGVQQIHYVVRSSAGLRLRGFELAAMAGADDPAPALESGYWWADPGLPNEFAGRGIGINIERQGGILSAVLYGYDEAGDPDWSLGSGSVGAQFSRLGLSRLSEGAGPHARYREPRELQSLGAMLVQPLSPSRARLWLAYLEPTTGDLSLREIEIVRFGFAPSPASAWAGEWLLAPAANDEGEVEARQFAFVALQGGRGEFTLLDASGDIALTCAMGGARSDRIPELCSLRLLRGETLTEYSFDRIGLRRMEGVDAEGRPVRMLLLGAD
jgi:hypothetical protein